MQQKKSLTLIYCRIIFVFIFVENFWHCITCSRFHPQHLHRTGMWGTWSPDNWTFVHMWPLRDMKGAGPHSQHNWPSWRQTNRLGTRINVIPRDILQLCYKCYWGQATCSGVNKTLHPASAVRYHLSKWHCAVCFSFSRLLWLDICQWSLPLSLYAHILEATYLSTQDEKWALSFGQRLVCDFISRKLQHRGDWLIDAHAKYKPSSFFNAPTPAEFQYALLLDYTTLKRVAQNLTL